MSRNIILMTSSKSLMPINNKSCDIFSIPTFIEKSNAIVNNLKLMSPAEFQVFFGLSNKLAGLNWQRYQNWELPFNLNNSRQAILYFYGDVYEGLSASDFDLSDFQYSQDHLRILSGLYGLLRPLDLIQPYRLEMGSSFKVERKESLYNFWRNEITQGVIDELGSNGRIVNLTSSEYFRAIDKPKVKGRVIDVEFKERKPDGLKVVPIYLKRARGLMARFAVKSKIANIENLKLFNYENYMFYEPLSTETKWVFVRESV